MKSCTRLFFLFMYLLAANTLTAQCIPFTCEDISLSGEIAGNSSAQQICGMFGDGCGGVITCNPCTGGETCGGGGIPFVCGTGSCTPLPCGSLAGISCGGGDGCGGLMDCACPPGTTCGGDDIPYSCGCTPTTCVAQGISEGIIANGCGAFLNCSLDPNFVCVLNQLIDIASPTAEQTAVLDALVSLPGSEQEDILCEFLGLQYVDSFLLAEIANQQFIRSLFVPVRSIVTGNPCCYDSCCAPLTLWGEVAYNYMHANKNNHCHGCNSSGFQVSVGTHTTFNGSCTVGGAFSYAYDNSSYKHAGHGNSSDYFGGLYGIYRPCDIYLLGDLVFGYRNERMKRHVHLTTVFGDDFVSTGQPKAFQSAFYIEGGKDFCLCNMLVQPFLGFEFSYYQRKGLKEHGDGPLNLCIHCKEHSNVFSRLGVHLTTLDLCCVEFGLDLAWQYRCTNASNNIIQNFTDFGTGCKINAGKINRNSIDGALFLATPLCECWELFGEASGQWWENAYSFSIIAGVKTYW